MRLPVPGVVAPSAEAVAVDRVVVVEMGFEEFSLRTCCSVVYNMALLYPMFVKVCQDVDIQ